MALRRLTFDKTAPRPEGMTTGCAFGIEAVPGPIPGTWAGTMREPGQLEMFLDSPLGNRGAVMLWLRTDQPYLNGAGAPEMKRPVISGEGLFDLNLSCTSVCAAVDWRFSERAKGVSRVFTPGLPGPQWIHFAFCWDAANGVYHGYVNGTPLRLPGARLQPWHMGATSTLTLHVDSMAVADLRVLDEPVTADDLEAVIPIAYRGSLDASLGARERGRMDVELCRGEVLYQSSLASRDDIAGWVMEGPGELAFEHGWMRMKSERPDGPNGHVVHWCGEDFPADCLLEWEIQPVSDFGLCIVFISGTGRNGEDIFDPTLEKRVGDFVQYTNGDINCYHMSYYANTPFNPGRITCNMRKNHGFYLVDNGPAGIRPGSKDVHKVAVLKRGPLVELGVDGRRIIRFHDDGRTYGPVLRGGKIGLRQMQWMEARYRNFRVSKIVGGTGILPVRIG